MSMLTTHLTVGVILFIGILFTLGTMGLMGKINDPKAILSGIFAAGAGVFTMLTFCSKTELASEALTSHDIILYESGSLLCGTLLLLVLVMRSFEHFNGKDFGQTTAVWFKIGGILVVSGLATFTIAKAITLNLPDANGPIVQFIAGALVAVGVLFFAFWFLMSQPKGKKVVLPKIAACVVIVADFFCIGGLVMKNIIHTNDSTVPDGFITWGIFAAGAAIVLMMFCFAFRACQLKQKYNVDI